MATGNRTLKLSILADVDDLKKKLGEADKAVEDNSNKISEICSGLGGFFIDASQALYESLLIYRAHLIYDQLTLSFLKLAGDAGR